MSHPLNNKKMTHKFVWGFTCTSRVSLIISDCFSFSTSRSCSLSPPISSCLRSICFCSSSWSFSAKRRKSFKRYSEAITTEITCLARSQYEKTKQNGPWDFCACKNQNKIQGPRHVISTEPLARGHLIRSLGHLVWHSTGPDWPPKIL